MSELSDLYQEVILDHSKRPHNFHVIEGASRQAQGHNPLCGDKVTVYLKMTGDKIEDIGFQGSGCAISKSAASVMTDEVKGKTKAEAENMIEKFRELVTGTKADQPSADELGKLAVFSGVCEFPTRIKCAILAWHTLHAALADPTKTVSTE